MANELPQRRFETAWLLNDIDLGHPESLRRTWALAAIAELILQALIHRDLSLARGIQTFIPPDRDLKQEFLDALTGLARMAWQEPNEVRSALLQLRRFDTDLIELVAMNSQSMISRAPASSSGASIATAGEPWGREFSSPNSTQYRTAQRRKLKSWISLEQYPIPSEQSPSENRQVEWNIIRELRAFVRDVVEPLFAELDILSYR